MEHGSTSSVVALRSSWRCSESLLSARDHNHNSRWASSSHRAWPRPGAGSRRRTVHPYCRVLTAVFTFNYTVAYSAMQAQNVATPFTLASAFSYVVSLPVAYFLGFHTSLGYIGIALLAIVSSIVKMILLAPILLQNVVFREAWPGWKWQEANRLAWKLWPLTGSCILLTTFQSAGFNIVALLCGFLPHADVVMSVNSIASTLVILGSIPMMGLSVAGTVRVGNALGAGQPRRASLASALVVGSMLVVSAVAVLFTWLFAYDYTSAYTSDSQTIEAAGRISVDLLPFVPIMGCVIATQAIFQTCGAQ